MTEMYIEKLTLEDLATKDPLTDESLLALTDAQILELVGGVVHNGSTLNRAWVFYFDLPAGKQARVSYKPSGVNECEALVIDVDADTRVSSFINYDPGKDNRPIGPFFTPKKYAVFAQFKYGRPSGKPWNQAPGRVIRETSTQLEYGFEDNYVNQNYRNMIVTINIV
jgi:hypothetical protein